MATMPTSFIVFPGRGIILVDISADLSGLVGKAPELGSHPPKKNWISVLALNDLE